MRSRSEIAAIPAISSSCPPHSLSWAGRSTQWRLWFSTHYHSDHVGSAERIRSESGATAFAPVGDGGRRDSGKVPVPGGSGVELLRAADDDALLHGDAVRNGGAKVTPVRRF